MKVRDVLQRDPATYPLVNQGQARIVEKAGKRELQELKGELETFVCEGQFADGMQRILSAYLTNLGQTSQRAAWVSGFFGSGKSHLLKMLCHLWQDTPFPDGSTARSLVPLLPDDLRASLRELDTVGKRSGGLLAAAGSLPSGSTENVRLTVLAILLRAVALPDQYPQAQFCLWLHDQGYYDRVKAMIEDAGRAWGAELNNLYVSGPLARAVLDCDPKFAPGETEARKTIREQFPSRLTDISTSEFLTAFKRVLKLRRGGRLPCTALILDEVQQYIADSTERSTLITEVVEAVSKQLDSHVMVIAAGQSALTESSLLQKLMDRFTIRVTLSDSDVETVTRKVLLQKKPSAIGDVRAILEGHAGEVSRQLQGTRIGESAEDRQVIVDDYPLLPVRRRFWEHCFRQVDVAGTTSQLRSQLRIIHDAVAEVSSQPLGAVIPGDELYEALAPNMVNTGVLLREINERIINLSKDGSPKGVLAHRICGLVFLIGKLRREAGADIGVRATKEHIGDLLVDDLAGDNGKFRSDVGTALEELASHGVLMRVGDEYRLQTKEGSEWDREFRNRQTRLSNNDADIQLRRDALLYAEADHIIRSLKMFQGDAKESRQLSIHREQSPPKIEGNSIPIWIRDGWSSREKDLVDEARVTGSDKPIIYVFIPRQSAQDLRKYLVDADAADQTLQFKGNPSTPEGQEAQRSMESRRDLAAQQRNDLVKQIVANAKVFQGGGSELLQLTLEERVREAANASLVRLFLRFKEADARASAWEAAVKRARDGSDQPFQPVGHSGSTEQHPVCQEVLATIGTGKTGSEVRKTLRASPYGWPQDAIDAALIALHRLQHVSTMLNGVPVPLGQLDQNKISKAEFRVERVTISVSDRLKVRKLFSQMRIQCKSGEETGKAAEFLEAVTTLAASSGGPLPLPEAPSIVDIDELKRLVGNEQLLAIKDKAEALEERITEWTGRKSLAEQRMPVWRTVERLAKHAAGIVEAVESLNQVTAIRDGRLLLVPADPVTPIRAALAAGLRDALNKAHGTHKKAYMAAKKTLEQNELWAQVPESERTRILATVGLEPPTKPDITTDETLLSSLDNRQLTGWQAEIDAVAGRMQRALELAAKHLEPKVRTVSLERATLRSEDDVHQWTSRQEKKLLDEVKKGPILTN